MRAITLHQPWASLIAAWMKWCETRSWPAPQSLWGTRIAIHAALRPVAKTAAVAALITRGGFDGPLPLGAVVATARLVDCGQVIDDAGDAGRVLRLAGGNSNEDVLVHDDGLGDYSLGRWVWRLGRCRAVGGAGACTGTAAHLDLDAAAGNDPARRCLRSSRRVAL